MATWLVRLRPRSSVGADLTSETLFGALCWALRRLEGTEALDRWLQRCCAQPPELALSSPLPFVDSDPPLHFFPMPLSLVPTSQTVTQVAGDDRRRLIAAIAAAKKISKAAYLSETLLQQATKGNLTPEGLLQQVLQGQIVTAGGCLLAVGDAKRLPEPKSAKQEQPLWETIDTLHTAVDRVAMGAAEGLLFYDTERFFAPKVGLFVLVRCPEDFPLTAVVRLWAHEALGGNRSAGKGHFVPDDPELADEWLAQLEAPDGNTVLLLSRCVPRKGEFEWQQSFYRLVTRRPKFESAFGQPDRVYKGILRFVAEGSTLVPTKQQPAYGQLLRVGTQTDWDGSVHSVYHNGIGFPLRMLSAEGSLS